MLKFTRHLFLCLVLTCGLPLTVAQAAKPQQIEQAHPDFELEQLARGLGVPWGMAFVADDRLLISERAGGFQLLDLTDLTLTPVTGAPAVVAAGQGGMMDVAVGPDFADDGWIYFTYSKAVNDAAATTLARARLSRQRLFDWQDLLITDSATSGGRHFGSRIAFDADGHVFFGVGDRGERDEAQNLNNHIGGIMRLNLDGSVPADNPFVGRDGRDEIWSYGHRNPQGLVYDRGNDRIWSIEHGPRGGDEINLIRKGLNYGWPVVSHGKEYWGPIAIGEGTSKSGLEDPRKVYIPSIAPGSLLFYDGEAFPRWRGNLLSGALKLRHINRVSVDADGRISGEERLLEELGERIRALIQGPEGWIYLSTDSGRIMRLRPPR